MSTYANHQSDEAFPTGDERLVYDKHVHRVRVLDAMPMRLEEIVKAIAEQKIGQVTVNVGTIFKGQPRQKLTQQAEIKVTPAAQKAADSVMQINDYKPLELHEKPVVQNEWTKTLTQLGVNVATQPANPALDIDAIRRNVENNAVAAELELPVEIAPKQAPLSDDDMSARIEAVYADVSPDPNMSWIEEITHKAEEIREQNNSEQTLETV